MIEELICQSPESRSPAAELHMARPPSPAIVSGPKDAVLLAAEWAFRQVYWRSAFLRSMMKRKSSSQKPSSQVVQRQELLDHLHQIGVVPGSLVMAHTSVSGLAINSGSVDQGAAPNSMRVAQDLLSVLLESVGESGTLCMPAHPLYKTGSRAASAESADSIPVYNPRTTPCKVGLANELFWRQPGTERSLHPHNTLAARGPVATELLRENLNASKPLAHGIHSGYYRFCQRNGLLLSVGVPLTNYLTLIHTSEETLDEQWPVRDFFEEQTYLLRNEGQDRSVTIRKTRAEFMKFSFCNRKLQRDLRHAGIVHEGRAGTVRVDWARAGDVYEFLSTRARTSTYPYFFTSLVPRKAIGHD